MSMRHTMKARRALTAVAITTGLALSVAGCGGDSGGEKPNAAPPAVPTTNKKPDEKPKETAAQPPAADSVLAEVKNAEGTTLTVNSAVRDTGGFLTVTGKVKNGKSSFWNPSTWVGGEKELSANGASMAGAAVVDPVGKKKYLVLRDTEGRCLCTKFTGGFKGNEEKSFFAQFPSPPATTAKVELQFADLPPAMVEISGGE